MGIYERTQRDVKKHDGFVPKSCWIAHMKEECGLPVKKAWNRNGKARIVPCPPKNKKAIRDSFKRQGLI
jgi:hypothetical protein